jgi:predicted acylesterase/phospholipase RssA
MIEVPVDSIGMLDFHRANEQIELGRKLAVRALNKFESDNDWMFPA